MSAQASLLSPPMILVGGSDDISADLEAARGLLYEPEPSDDDVCRLARILARNDMGGEVWRYARDLGVTKAPRFKLLHDFWTLTGLPADDFSMLDVEIGVWLKARCLWSPGQSVGGSVSTELTVPVIGGWALRVRRTQGVLGVAPVEWLIMPPNPNPRQRRPAKCWALTLNNLDIFARFMREATFAAQTITREASERAAAKRREKMSEAERAAYAREEEARRREQARALQEVTMRALAVEIKVRLQRHGVDLDTITTHAARPDNHGNLVKMWSRTGSAAWALWASVLEDGTIYLTIRPEDGPTRFDAASIADEMCHFEQLDLDPFIRHLAGQPPKMRHNPEEAHP